MITEDFVKYPIPSPLFTKSYINSVVDTSITGLSFKLGLSLLITSSSIFLVEVLSAGNNIWYLFNSLKSIILSANLIYFLLATKQLSKLIKGTIFIPLISCPKGELSIIISISLLVNISSISLVERLSI